MITARYCPRVPELVILSRDLEDADPVQRQLAPVRDPELHEGTRPEGSRHDDLMPPGRPGFVQLETGSAHGLDAGTLELQQNADAATGCRPGPLDGQEPR